MRPAIYTAPPQPEVAIPWAQGAPIRGMDGRVPLHQMPPDVAVFLYNLIPSEYGCETRAGYQTWAENIAGGSVKSLLPFVGQIGDFSTSRLFCATSNGIFDVTAQMTNNPTAVVTFGNQTAEAGFCSHLHFTNPNGQQVLLLADSRNGMYEYDPTGAVWTKYTTEITFPDTTTPADIVFLAVHKSRLWLIARDSPDAYYLPVGAKAGVATKFQFGSKMVNGGYLVAIHNWSADGGDGLDDYMIAIAKGGDVLVYRGTDPAQASTWSLVGRWSIGFIPDQRRVAIEVGGDTLLLSSYGITSVSALLQGIDPTRVEQNITGNLARLVREALKAKKNLPYWEVKTLPDDGLLVINSPKELNERHIQFVLNLNRVGQEEGGWGLWRDVPATTFATYDSNVFFGTEDGTVRIMQGSSDNVGSDGSNGTEVEFSMLTGFTNAEFPGMYKQVQFTRPQFISNNIVSIACRTSYDFNLSQPNLTPGTVNQPGFKWDSALWDQALWSGTFSTYTLCGASGYGREFATYLEGSTVSRATLVSIEGTFVPWKFL